MAKTAAKTRYWAAQRPDEVPPMSEAITTSMKIEPVVYHVDDLQRLLGIRRASAYALARKLGVRVGQRKIVIPKERFENWLATERVRPLDAGDRS
jgi:hypothetical protein